MRQFHYRALDGSGRAFQGSMRALDVLDLEERLRAGGRELLACHRVILPWRPGLKRRELIGFCFHLEQGLRAGIPMLECLHDLRDDSAGQRLSALATALADSIEDGASLSEALAAHPEVFGEVLLGLVQAGEHSGGLPEVLRKLGAYLRQQDEFISRTRRLLAYPLLLLVVILVVVCFLLVWLVPELSQFLHGLGRQLPWHTLALIRLSQWFIDFWYWLVPGICAVPALLYAGRRYPPLRHRLDAWLLRLPTLGPLLHKLILARVAAALHIMYGAGMSLLECLQLAAKVAGNHAVAKAMHAAGEQIRGGAGLAESFRATALFPSLVVRMIRIGESTGALEQCLAQVCYFYERDVRESAEQFQTLIEPTMTVLFGVLLAWVVVAMMGPVYELVLALPL